MLNESKQTRLALMASTLYSIGQMRIRLSLAPLLLPLLQHRYLTILVDMLESPLLAPFVNIIIIIIIIKVNQKHFDVNSLVAVVQKTVRSCSKYNKPLAINLWQFPGPFSRMMETMIYKNYDTFSKIESRLLSLTV